MATPLLIAQVTALVASWAARIAQWLRSLIGSLERLAGQCQELERLIEALKRALHRSPATEKESPRVVRQGAYFGVPPETLIANRGADVGRQGAGPRECERLETLRTSRIFSTR